MLRTAFSTLSRTSPHSRPGHSHIAGFWKPQVRKMALNFGRTSSMVEQGSSPQTAPGDGTDPEKKKPTPQFNEIPSIELPSNLSQPSNVTAIFLDIGGSLAKVAYYSKKVGRRHSISIGQESEIAAGDSYGRLHFCKFQTKEINDMVDFVKNKLLKGNQQVATITATGGGAYKYVDLIQRELGVTMVQEDEMECVVAGANFLLRKIPEEAFTYNKYADPPTRFQRVGDRIFPYMLVNIGSGVSMIKVEGPYKWKRIGGTSLGGGTFWGLCSLLTKAKGFDDALELCTKGNGANVDMLVGDIYDGDYSKIGLSKDTIACSFGKAMRSSFKGEQQEYKDEDVAKSLLHMISNNIGQIAYLQAQLHGLKRIYFGGYFIRNHQYTMHTISYAINFWSKGAMNALFLRHEGYLGAVGAFVLHCGRDDKRQSWAENFVANHYGLLDPMALDSTGFQAMRFPHLRDDDYQPDTVKLDENPEMKKYWIQHFANKLPVVTQQLIDSEGGSGEEDAVLRGSLFQRKMEHLLTLLNDQPNALGLLSVRGLFDLQAQCARECKFSNDPWYMVKRKEFDAALTELPSLLATYRAMDWDRRQRALIQGVLAGNVFDWGATAIAEMMENGHLNFSKAWAILPSRPWLFDDLDGWVARLKAGVHSKAIVFVDNSGADIVLGVIPFVVELLERGTEVIIAANSEPVLNDVTFTELSERLADLAAADPVIDNALKAQRLSIMETGMESPCLDLARIESHLAEESRTADLVVLEGMGRAIHTNLYARFTCDTLKLATIKSVKVAELLGGKMYDVVCRYEPAPVGLPVASDSNNNGTESGQSSQADL
eukprot:comp23291_c3_seq1/m.38208 comp23291_c3_seq1/g.38208  ORF comp23291_c3_seq1/g.38208 comp23291_c3_seq1/m.38208 type:complete len:827 (-) comp23291_c3_seq1:535-3015(-)